MRGLTMVVLTILSLFGCASTGGSTAPVATTAPATTAPATAGPSASPPAADSPSAGRTIGFADNGKAIQFVIGERFALVLGTDFDWTLAPTDEAVIMRVRNITVVRGGQGVFEVVGRGTAVLSATGDPPCRKSTPPCGAPSIVFQVTISAG